MLLTTIAMFVHRQTFFICNRLIPTFSKLTGKIWTCVHQMLKCLYLLDVLDQVCFLLQEQTLLEKLQMVLVRLYNKDFIKQFDTFPTIDSMPWVMDIL